MSVYVVIGSPHDQEYAKECTTLLREFGIAYRLFVASAHRSPEKIDQIIQEMEKENVQVVIAMAGFAAHLPGILASKTLCPVIGVPLDSSSLLGLDALFSIVQMPAGIPCAGVGIGKSGARNAALLAVEIVSLTDPALKERLRIYREEQRLALERASQDIERQE
ncbi:MAG: 5-(carboxyamino)imidazole ribonucleotide mutase [Candidatus Atribacteria bacterium]|nr:5-(carboxyamino)imidazole ribonucleotide mutase [Candidatus Atribacteria bacterium]